MFKPTDLTKKVHRVKFRKWAELEDLRGTFVRAAEDNADDFPHKLFAYLSAALEVKEEKIINLPWIDVVELVYSIYAENLPSPNLPLVTDVPKEKSPAKPDWDYPGRTWNYYAHVIAQAYGWTLEYVAELDIDTALALIQEILTDEQLEKEFQWGMSEAAYSYNKVTKQSVFNELPRPQWMRGKAKEVKKIKIPKSLMPQGLVITDAKNSAKVENSQSG